MASKSIKAQIPMTEIYYLPPPEKPNQEIQLDFAGPTRVKRRRFFLLVSKNRYMRNTNRENSKTFFGAIYHIEWTAPYDQNGYRYSPYRKEFWDFCKSLNIKIIYGTLYINTPTGLVEREIKTFKNFLRATLEEGKNLIEALSRSLDTMRTTVHSSIKETPLQTSLLKT